MTFGKYWKEEIQQPLLEGNVLISECKEEYLAEVTWNYQQKRIDELEADNKKLNKEFFDYKVMCDAESDRDSENIKTLRGYISSLLSDDNKKRYDEQFLLDNGNRRFNGYWVVREQGEKILKEAKG